MIELKVVAWMVGIVLAVFIVLACWCCCVMASKADEQMEKFRREGDDE